MGIPSSTEICASYVEKASSKIPVFDQASLLFHLLHVQHCRTSNDTQCAIISHCNEIKALYEHVRNCTQHACSVDKCVEAKDILDHWKEKPTRCNKPTLCNHPTRCNNNSMMALDCTVCGMVSSVLQGAQAVGDDFALIKPSQFHVYRQLATSNLIATDDTAFFIKEPVHNVFSERKSDNPSESSCQYEYLSDITNQVQSQIFIETVVLHKFNSPTVEINTQIFRSEMYDAFVKEGRNCLSTEDEAKYNVQIVFHGTAEMNIDAILKNGLDPTKRTAQMLGQGEYFSCSPAMPLRYCRGGLKMIIFAVITETSDYRGRGVIVVKKSQRQLPIATLSFAGFESSAMKLGMTFASLIDEMRALAEEKEKQAKEARSKEKIVRLLIEGEYLAASELYNNACGEKNNGMPPKLWADEMAVYVRDHLRDPEMVDIYFPNLPERPASSKLNIRSTETFEEEAKSAKRKLELATLNKK